MEVEVATLLAQRSYDAWLVGIGIPPTIQDQEPLGFVDGLLVLGTMVLAFWLSVRFLTWIEAKLESRRLVREIYREYRKHRSRPRGPGDSKHTG